MKFKNLDFLRWFCVVPVQTFRSHIRPLRPGLGLTMTFVIFHSYILFSYASNQGLFFFSSICFWRTRGSFSSFSPLLPLTEVSSQPSAIPGGNPPGDWQSVVGWGDARFEPGTAVQQSGTLPLSHHAFRIETPCLFFLTYQ
jgi:hypothetical protein